MISMVEIVYKVPGISTKKKACFRCFLSPLLYLHLVIFDNVLSTVTLWTQLPLFPVMLQVPGETRAVGLTT